MSTERGDEGLNEDEDDSDSSRTPPTLLDLTPVDPVISELYTSIIEHQQPEAIESDIPDQTEEDVDSGNQEGRRGGEQREVRVASTGVQGAKRKPSGQPCLVMASPCTRRHHFGISMPARMVAGTRM